MSFNLKSRHLYAITDDTLTPQATLLHQVESALEGGATIIQLRDKSSDRLTVIDSIKQMQALCKKYNALFVLNDYVDLAIGLECDGLHIGKSDHDNFTSIRKNFKGVLGVSCYGDIELAKHFEAQGADYVAFGSFYTSPTKPHANIVSLETLDRAQEELSIPICAIGGINEENITEVMQHTPDMVSLVNAIWNSDNVIKQTQKLVSKLKEKE